MPKETLKNLDHDAERLLFAGAQAARQDSALEAARAKLAPLGAKAPALAKVVEQVEKVRQAAPKAAAAELLNLAALMAQVRGAQAAPLAVPEGELAPLPRTEPMGSPLSPVELTTLIGALTGAKDVKHRARTIEDAVERGTARDLRLLPYCAAALGDSAISGVVESKLLPKLGDAVVPELRAALNLQGRVADASRLRALARIEGKAALPLVLEAVEKGSPELRAAAITSLAVIDRAVADPIAIKLLETDRSVEVKRAGAVALGGSSSDAALEALIKLFRGSEELRDEAHELLVTSPHPQTTNRVIAMLTPELLALEPFKLKKAGAKGAKASGNAALKHQDEVELLRMAIELLGERQDKAAHPFLLQVFREHKLENVRDTAALALLMSGYEDGSGALTPSLFRANHQLLGLYFQTIIARDPARAFDQLGHLLASANLKSKDVVRVAQVLLSSIIHDGWDEQVELADGRASWTATSKITTLIHADPRWASALAALMDSPELTEEVLRLVATARPAQALEALLKLTATAKRESFEQCVYVLVQYRDERIPKLLVELLAQPGSTWRRLPVLHWLRHYDDPAAAPLLKAWMQREKRLEKAVKEAFTELIQFLERDRSLTASA